VAALPDPAGWVRVGDVRYECATVNLDCTNNSSGLLLSTSAAVADACATLVAWVASTTAFVDPVGVVDLTTSRPPTVADCTSEMTTRERYLITAAGPGQVSGDGGSRWQLLMSPDHAGSGLSVTLGDPPQRIAGLAA
jgi:hypothetical protein